MPKATLSFLFGIVLLGVPVLAQAQIQPPMPDWQTDADYCQWQWRQADGLGLWTETCRLPTGLWLVDWDTEKRAFVTRRNGLIVDMAVQSWRFSSAKGLGALREALKEALIEAGHLEVNAPCHWQTIVRRPAARTTAFHVLSPTSPTALEPQANDQVPAPVCGPYGASTHGVRYFMTDLRWPDRAIFLQEDQKRPLFDVDSLVVSP